MKKLLPIYNKALDLYKERKFHEAIGEFTKCLEILPEDGPSKLYLQRCQDYIDNPPPDDWDGVYTMTTK